MSAGREVTRRSAARREDGQALVLSVVTLFVLLGCVAMVIDFGRAYVAQRQLQQAVDAAALAAGQSLPDGAIARGQAISYSATGRNAHPSSMTAAAPTVVFRCLQRLVDQNIPCKIDPTPGSPCATTGCNAVQVTQTATVSTLFARIFIPRFSLTARSTVGMRGGAPRPLDIMVVLDRSGSMNQPCGEAVKDPGGAVVIPAGTTSKIDCAKDGIRQLLKGLLPCDPKVGQSCGSADPLDKVGLMVFPPLTEPNATTHDNTANPAHSNLNLETNASCSGEFSSALPWYQKPDGRVFPNWFIRANSKVADLSDVGYYGVVGSEPDYTFAALSNDFRIGPPKGMNPSSRLVQAITWASCQGLKGQGSGITTEGFASESAQGFPGNRFYGINAVGGTYYGGAILAAQAALAADGIQNPGRQAQPVIIVLSDGEGSEGSTTPCASAISAAQAAAQAGTWVYSIAYKLDSTHPCTVDDNVPESPPINAYTAMANLARDSATPTEPDLTKFFCPGTIDQLPGLPCQDGDTLTDVFASIGTSLTTSRILPDDID